MSILPRCFLTPTPVSTNNITPVLTGWTNAGAGPSGTAPVAGDFVVLIGTVAQASQTVTQGSGTGTWTIQADDNNAGPGSLTTYVIYRLFDGTETGPKFQWTTAGFVTWVLVAFAPDADTVLAVDVWATTQVDTAVATTHTPNAATATAGQADCSVIMAGAIANTGATNNLAFTAPSGWTTIGSSPEKSTTRSQGSTMSYQTGVTGTVTPGAVTIEGGTSSSGTTAANLYHLLIQAIPLALAGAASSASATTAALAWQAALAGTASSVSATAGSLTQAMALTGTAPSASAASGSFTQTMVLAGTSPNVSAASGALAWTAVLAGTASSASGASGALAWTIKLAGTAANTSATSGALAWTIILTGTASSASATSGALAWTAVITGTAASASATSGALAWTIVLAGTSASVSSAAGDVTKSSAAALAGTSASGGSGSLAWTAVLAGTASSASTAAGSLAWIATLGGTASSSSLAAGALTQAMALAGTAGSVSAGSGTFAQTMALAGTAGSVSATTAALTLISAAITFSCPGFTAATVASEGVPDAASGQLLWKIADAGDVALSGSSGDYTVTASTACPMAADSVAVSGSAPGAPFDGAPSSGEANAASTTVTVASATTAADDEYLAWFAYSRISAGGTPPAITPPAGFTTRAAFTASADGSKGNAGVLFADALQVSAGPVGSVNGSIGSSQGNGGVLLVVAIATGTSFFIASSIDGTALESASGSFTQTMTFGGSAATLSSAAGVLASTEILAGTAVSVSSAGTALLDVTMALSATASSVSQTSGALGSQVMTLAGSASSSASTGGALAQSMALGGSAVSASSTGGDFSQVWALSGTADSSLGAGYYSPAGAFGAFKAIAGAAVTVSVAAGALPLVGIGGTADSSGFLAAGGDLTDVGGPITFGIDGSAVSLSAASGGFIATAAMAGSSVTVSEGDGVFGGGGVDALFAEIIVNEILLGSFTAAWVFSGTAASQSMAAAVVKLIGPVNYGMAVQGTMGVPSASAGEFGVPTAMFPASPGGGT